MPKAIYQISFEKKAAFTYAKNYFIFSQRINTRGTELHCATRDLKKMQRVDSIN